MSLESVSGRAFLDTSVVNFILDFGEQIHDGAPVPMGLDPRVADDIDALYNIFLSGQRLSWQLAVSPYTYIEVIRTEANFRRHRLENWFLEIWDYWRQLVNDNNDLPSFIEGEHIRVSLLCSDVLEVLPNFGDHLLFIDAIVYRCDCFCTRDWKTILRHRDKLKSLPIQIVTPVEWWNMIKPWAFL